MHQEDRFNCKECGMNVDGREYHPYLFCVLYKNNIDPRGPSALDIFQKALDEWQEPQP